MPPSGNLLNILQERFEAHSERHAGVNWNTVASRLQSQPQKWKSLQWMEETGGEPDLVVMGTTTDSWCYVDCAAESPAGRRSLCYDRQGLESRKEHRPEGNALEQCAKAGIELLDESGYRYLQTLGAFDAKTSSWLATPPDVRQRGGALFGDSRYGRVFVYHNGAQSYYAARGFRGLLRI
jgi:hypothetical protein